MEIKRNFLVRIPKKSLSLATSEEVNQKVDLMLKGSDRPESESQRADIALAMI